MALKLINMQNMTPGQCHLRSISQQTCPWEDFLQSMCSKTVQPPDGTVVLLLFPCTLSFPEKGCVFMIVWINPCLPVHPAGEPSGEVMRGPSWETGWRKRCRERGMEREGRGGENNTKLTPHCRGRKKIFNACVQRICKRSYPSSETYNYKIQFSEFFIHFATRALKLIWRDGSRKNKNSDTFMFFQNCMTSVENQGEV